MRPSSRIRQSEYPSLLELLSESSLPEQTQAMRELCRTDLYFLLRYILNRRDMEHPWLFQRCREVETSPDGYLDLWARGHYKSTIITFGKTIQDILASHGDDPLPEFNGVELTFGIFSHTRPIAKAFLRQIKNEFENNRSLLELFPDVLFANPERRASSWSEDAGISVRRNTNPKEATVEAWGLVDGQPTGKHFNVLIYDDVVTRSSVTTPEMIAKTTEAWELSLNLGDRAPRKRMIGTRYHFADTYREVMKREAAKPRLHPATANGELTGAPVFLTPEQYEQKVKEMGPYAASSQLLLNPIADALQTFKRSWINHYSEASNWQQMNRVLICDPANAKKKTSDYTAMGVLGKGPDGNLYLLDGVRDRLSLKERAERFIEMHRRWKPMISAYEKYGKDADIDYITETQNRTNYRFLVQEVGGPLTKQDRISRLIPLAANGKLWFPEVMHRTLADGKFVDLVQVIIEEELLPWPVPVHDDFVDMMSRIFDLETAVPWPKGGEEGPREDRYSKRRSQTTWMAR